MLNLFCPLSFFLLKAKVWESWHLAHHFDTQENKDFLGNERHEIVIAKDHRAIFVYTQKKNKRTIYTRVAMAMDFGFHA
jgi:hypothetical protein